MKILISAGEVSGDIAGARVAAALRERSDARFVGLGGARMESAGVELMAAATHLGTVGVSESLRAVPAMLEPARALRRMMREHPPDAALLIGNDIFNVILGRWCRAAGVPVVSFFPPQVWIWRSLAWLFSKSFDVVAASFPEEVETYSGHVRTEYVGHYLADVVEPRSDDATVAARESLGLRPGSRVVTILPGSRKQELRTLLGMMLDAAGAIAAANPDVSFLLPVSDGRFEPEIVARVRDSGLAGKVTVVSDSHASMRASDLIVAASGTATLEATLIGVPMVVAYRVSLLTHAVVRAAVIARLMRGETVALPNLLLGRHVVPELTQSRATAAEIAREAIALLEDEGRREAMRRELRDARALIARAGTINRVADLVLREAARRQSAVAGTGTVPAAAPRASEGRS